MYQRMMKKKKTERSRRHKLRILRKKSQVVRCKLTVLRTKKVLIEMITQNCKIL